MIILPTRQAVHIGRKLEDLKKEGDSLASDLGFIWLGSNHDGKIEFPDREIYTNVSNIEEIDGEDVVVLHSGAPRPNSSGLRLLQTLSSLNNPQKSGGKIVRDGKTVKDYAPLGVKAKSKKVFFLYPGYGMQDWPDKTGSINAIRDLFDICMQMYGVDQFFTIDGHFTGEDWTKDYPLVNVSALPLLVKKAEKQGYKDMVLIGPDEGTLRRNGLKGLSKKRLDSYRTETEIPECLREELEGKYVGIVDDLFETGNTMYEAGKIVKGCNPEKLAALITHMRLEQGFVRLIEGPFKDVYVTNTIDNSYASVNVTNLVADTLQKHC